MIDAAAGGRRPRVYMLTGGRGDADLGAGRRPVLRRSPRACVQAQQAGVALAIENASSLYADIHIAHTLRDTIALAEMAELGICIDLFHCWAEADLTRPGAIGRCRGPS